MPHTRFDIYRMSFFPRIVRIWNLLPDDIVSSASDQIFKSGMQHSFIGDNIYMVLEKITPKNHDLEEWCLKKEPHIKPQKTCKH